MQYFLGSLITLCAILFGIFIFNLLEMPKNNTIFRYSQSHIYELVRPLLPPPKLITKQKRYQSTNFEEKTNVRVIILGSKAYWIKDNMFYVADVDGTEINKDSATVVDIFSMDKVQLDKMVFIIDQLRDGKVDDSGDSGK